MRYHFCYLGEKKRKKKNLHQLKQSKSAFPGPQGVRGEKHKTNHRVTLCLFCCLHFSDGLFFLCKTRGQRLPFVGRATVSGTHGAGPGVQRGGP